MTQVSRVGAYSADITLSGDSLRVSMVIDISGLKLGRNESVRFTPSIRTAEQSLDLPYVTVMGRNRYILWNRNKKSQNGEAYLWHPGMSGRLLYETKILYKDWMKSADLYLSDSRTKCCKTKVRDGILLDEGILLEQAPRIFEPKFTFIKSDGTAERQSKERSVSGTAYVGFPVNSWDILENYRNNFIELDKIRRTIENIRVEREAEITAIHLKGYASPESSWAHNAMLAERRTDALKSYLQNRYGISSNVIHTSYEAEDWAGLRAFVEEYPMPNKMDILAIIDSSLHPDVKEYEIKSRYPDEYRTLLRECYPRLRHSDYRIEYRLRT